MDHTTYQIASKTDSRRLTDSLCQEGPFLLPMVELITGAEMAVDELIDVTGRATIEAVLTLSAQEVVGPPEEPYFWSPDSKWISQGRRQVEKTRPEGVLWEMDVGEAVAKLAK